MPSFPGKECPLPDIIEKKTVVYFLGWDDRFFLAIRSFCSSVWESSDIGSAIFQKDIGFFFFDKILALLFYRILNKDLLESKDILFIVNTLTIYWLLRWEKDILFSVITT